MRISKEKAAENRERVLQAATRLFRERGFDGVGVADLMHAAGLTHGGFYNHFQSKADLEVAACTHAFETSVAIISKTADIADPKARAAAFDRHVENYLSATARDATGARCPMVAFAADVARQDKEVKQAYSIALRAYIEAFAKAAAPATGGKPSELRQDALARMATLVGALVLARSVATEDAELSEEILTAGKRAASLRSR